MAFLQVGSENSAPVELFYEDHGSGSLMIGFAPYSRTGAALPLNPGSACVLQADRNSRQMAGRTLAG